MQISNYANKQMLAEAIHGGERYTGQIPYLIRRNFLTLNDITNEPMYMLDNKDVFEYIRTPFPDGLGTTVTVLKSQIDAAIELTEYRVKEYENERAKLIESERKTGERATVYIDNKEESIISLTFTISELNKQCEDFKLIKSEFSALLNASVQPASRDGNPHNKPDLSQVKTQDKIGGDSKERIIRTLKRDDKKLAQLVIDGEITAQEGKRRWKVAQGKRPTWNIYCNPMNLESFVVNLHSKLTPDEIAELIELLRMLQDGN